MFSIDVLRLAFFESRLARGPHYHVHFTPTSASWINQVERWFAELTRKRLRRPVHTSVRQLEADIHSFIDRHNQNPRPSNGRNLPTKSWLQ
jgi:transposase